MRQDAVFAIFHEIDSPKSQCGKRLKLVRFCLWDVMFLDAKLASTLQSKERNVLNPIPPHIFFWISRALPSTLLEGLVLFFAFIITPHFLFAKTIIHPDTGARISFANTSSNTQVAERPCSPSSYIESRRSSQQHKAPDIFVNEGLFGEIVYDDLVNSALRDPRNLIHLGPDLFVFYDCRLSWRAPEKMTSPSCSSEIFRDFDFNYSFEHDALRNGRWCHKQNPQNKDDILNHGMDVPANFINLWTSDYLQKKWSEGENGAPKPVFDPLDPEYLKVRAQIDDVPIRWLGENGFYPELSTSRLSLRYHKNGRYYSLSELIDAYARDIYEKSMGFQKASTGGEDSQVLFQLNVRASHLWEKMVQCAGDAENARVAYAQADWASSSCPELQTEIAGFIVNLRNTYETAALKSSLEVINGVRVNRPPLPAIHPLFTQVAMQFLTTTIGVGTDKSLRRLNRDLKNRINNITPEFYRQSLEILKFLPHTECNSYGLWPSAGLSVLKATNRRSADLLSGGNFFDPGATTSKCADARGNWQRLPQVYQDYSNDLALQFSGITERYLKSLEKSKKK